MMNFDWIFHFKQFWTILSRSMGLKAPWENLVKFEHAWESPGAHQSSWVPSLYSPNGFTTSYIKSTQTIKPFLRYLNLKNRAIWLANSFSGHNSRTRIFQNMCFLQNSEEYYVALFWAKKHTHQWTTFW